jgi:hypothetical protein
VAAERGTWIEKWDTPEILVDPEEIAAWKPVIEGEKVARRVAHTLRTLTAGADSELPDHRLPMSKKLRSSYNRLWVAWKSLDERKGHRWALIEVDMSIDATAYRLARSWSIEEFVTKEVPEIRHNALIAVRHTLEVVGTRSTRGERKEANEIMAIVGKELDYLAWSL